MIYTIRPTGLIKLKVKILLSETTLQITLALELRESRIKVNAFRVHRLNFIRTDNFQVHNKDVKSTISTHPFYGPLKLLHWLFFVDHGLL